MSPDGLLGLCRESVARAAKLGADQAEVCASSVHESKVNLESDDLGTAQTHQEENFGIRVRRAGSTGFSATNDASPAAIDEAIEAALALARVTPPDPHDAIAEPEPASAVEGLYDAALAELDVASVGRLCGELAARVRAIDPRVRLDSGWVSVGSSVSALASSTGSEVSERATDAQALLFGMAVDGDKVGSFDHEAADVCSLREFEAELKLVPERFVTRVLSPLEAGPGRTFCGSLVLSAEAVAEFVLPALSDALSAQSVRTGSSLLAGKLGERLFSEGLTLVDDAGLPGRPGSSAFDREGLAHQRLVLIDAGRPREYLYNSREARAAERAAGSTRHAAGGARTPPGIGPTNLLLAAGELDRDALLGEVAEGVLLQRFSGNTDPVSGDFSGVAKGSFLLSRGEPPRPITETLLSGNLFELLAQISGIGRELRWIDGSVCVPMLRLEGVSVTSN